MSLMESKPAGAQAPIGNRLVPQGIGFESHALRHHIY